jgi:excisionase family DNA binding protein
MSDVLISVTTAKAVQGFLGPMVASGTIAKTEAKAVSQLLKKASRHAPAQPVAASKAKPGLLTVEQSAERLCCSKRTVLRMADAGQLERIFLRPGSHKSLRFREVDVNAIVAGE